MFIFSIHAVNAFLGCASFSWPHIPPSLGVMAWVKLCGLVGLLIVQGTVMASAISLVEELLFRSWNHNSRAGIFFLAEVCLLSRIMFCLCYLCIYYACITPFTRQLIAFFILSSPKNLVKISHFLFSVCLSFFLSLYVCLFR
jgi:hypothetical protein